LTPQGVFPLFRLGARWRPSAIGSLPLCGVAWAGTCGQPGPLPNAGAPAITPAAARPSRLAAPRPRDCDGIAMARPSSISFASRHVFTRPRPNSDVLALASRSVPLQPVRRVASLTDCSAFARGSPINSVTPNTGMTAATNTSRAQRPARTGHADGRRIDQAR